jgi:hypothetical protein
MIYEAIYPAMKSSLKASLTGGQAVNLLKRSESSQFPFGLRSEGDA